MSRRLLFFGIGVVVITIVNALWPEAPSPLTNSSFGKSGSGHAALYDLLSESGLARGRSFEASRRLADSGTLWWIDPEGVCDGAVEAAGEREEALGAAVERCQRGPGFSTGVLHTGVGDELAEVSPSLVALDQHGERGVAL